MQELKRAIFLKGVYDPADASRITTTLYRPKHVDLRLEDGLVRAGNLAVPLNNVVELQLHDAEKPVAPAVDPRQVTVEQVLDSLNIGSEAVATTEDAPKRRGRPRKLP